VARVSMCVIGNMRVWEWYRGWGVADGDMDFRQRA
jgi:hypothetical protein